MVAGLSFDGSGGEKHGYAIVNREDAATFRPDPIKELAGGHRKSKKVRDSTDWVVGHEQGQE